MNTVLSFDFLAVLITNNKHVSFNIVIVSRPSRHSNMYNRGIYVC